MSLSNTFKIKALALDSGVADGRTADLASAAEANVTISGFIKGNDPSSDNTLDPVVA